MHGAAGLVAETNASRTGFEAKATRAEEPLTAPAASPQSGGRRELIIGPHQISSLVITGYRPGDARLCFFDGPIRSSSARDLRFDAGCRPVIGGSAKSGYPGAAVIDPPDIQSVRRASGVAQ